MDFQLSRDRDLDLGSDHTAYSHTSLIDLYLHATFHWNHGQTNGRTFETHFIRSTQKNQPKNGSCDTDYAPFRGDLSP